MISTVNSAEDIPCVMSDPEGFEEMSKCVMDMFDREVFDCIVTSGDQGHVFGGLIASKMRKPVICADDNSFCTKNLKDGMKVIVMADTLKDGTEHLDLVQRIESTGCKVIRIGFVSELTSFGARKSRILRRYPFEAIFTI